MRAFPFFKTATGQPDFTQEVCTQEFDPSRPVPNNPTAIVYRARFTQLRAYYARPAGNSAHPNLPQVYFADDIDHQDRLNGLVEWTRVWTTIPASYNDAESYAYTYPGLLNYNSNISRAEWTPTVTSKLIKDYFLVGTLPTFKTNTTNYDDCNNADWVKAAVTTTVNALAIPVCAGGGTVAAKIIESNTNAVHIVNQKAPIAGLAAGSVFLHAGERTRAWVRLTDDTTNVVGDATLDMLTGNFVETVNANCTIAAIGDGWWRVNLTANCSGNANIGFGPAKTDDSHSYQGDGASGIYAWRGMVAPNITPAATVPPTLTPDGGSNTYPVATFDVIPSYFALRYFYGVSFGVTTLGNILIAPPTITGAMSMLTDTFFAPNSNVNLLWTASNPTLTNYNANITTDNGNANSYSIEAEGSVLALVYGSGTLWERTRRQVKAR